MTTALTIATAVAALLSAAAPGTFNQTVTVVDPAIPSSKPADLETAKLTVVPSSEAGQTLGRATLVWDTTIDIGVERIVGVENRDDLAEMIELTKQVAKYLAFRSIAVEGVSYQSITIDPVYDPGEIRDKGRFISVVHVRYLNHVQ